MQTLLRIALLFLVVLFFDWLFLGLFAVGLLAYRGTPLLLPLAGVLEPDSPVVGVVEVVLKPLIESIKLRRRNLLYIPFRLTNGVHGLMSLVLFGDFLFGLLHIGMHNQLIGIGPLTLHRGRLALQRVVLPELLLLNRTLLLVHLRVVWVVPTRILRLVQRTVRLV